MFPCFYEILWGYVVDKIKYTIYLNTINKMNCIFMTIKLSAITLCLLYTMPLIGCLANVVVII